MPSLDVLRAQLLGLLNQPASMFVRVINAVPQGLVNVLQAKVRAAGQANQPFNPTFQRGPPGSRKPDEKQNQTQQARDTSLKRAPNPGR